MHLTPHVTLRNLLHSAAIEAHILKRIEKIDQICPNIMHFDVVVEQIQRHKHQGKLYNARITVTVPGEELAVTRAQDEDVYVAIRDAFNAERRKLLNYTRRRRREVKEHVIPLQGRVARVFEHDQFGFIEANGEEYFFNHHNMVNGDFGQLKAGACVQFLPSIGEEGLQAHRVSCGKHNVFGEPEDVL